MLIKTIPVGMYQANCYVVIDEEKVVEYKYKNKAKGNRLRKNTEDEVDTKTINKTND